jgi:hypothetical protein
MARLAAAFKHWMGQAGQVGYPMFLLSSHAGFMLLNLIWVLWVYLDQPCRIDLDRDIVCRVQVQQHNIFVFVVALVVWHIHIHSFSFAYPARLLLPCLQGASLLLTKGAAELCVPPEQGGGGSSSSSAERMGQAFVLAAAPGHAVHRHPSSMPARWAT